MCVDIGFFSETEKEITAYKMVRYNHGFFESLFYPVNRAPQIDLSGKYYSHKGEFIRYELGKTYTSNLPGFYCFRGVQFPPHFGKIPIGARISYGVDHNGSKTINSTIIEIIGVMI